MGTSVSYEHKETGKYIHNLFTQYNVGYGKNARYNYLVTAVIQACQEITQVIEPLKRARSPIEKAGMDRIKIAIPRIGAGLGGLEWYIVRELLVELEERLLVEF